VLQSRKLQRSEFLVKPLKREAIDDSYYLSCATEVAYELARGDEVSQIFARKPCPQPSEFLTLSAKRLLQQYPPKGDTSFDRIKTLSETRADWYFRQHWEDRTGDSCRWHLTKQKDFLCLIRQMKNLRMEARTLDGSLIPEFCVHLDDSPSIVPTDATARAVLWRLRVCGDLRPYSVHFFAGSEEVAHIEWSEVI